jgi:peptide/nickel transport system permease protein
VAQQEQKLPSQNLLHTESQVELGVGAGLQASEADTVPATRVSSPARDAWRRFRRNWAAMGSLAVLLVLILMAIFAPFMHTMSPFSQDYSLLDISPSPQHWFGTDGVGRDLYSRLVYGLRPPFVVGLVGTSITVVLGTLIGVSAGFFGGISDTLLSRFTDFMFAFPGFLLTLIVVSLFGPSLDPYFGGAGRTVLLTVVFALVSWPALMRFTRSLALGLKEQQFVEAARTSGSTQWQIIIRHLLPNMWGLILVQASFIVVAVITNETILSILGLGIAPPNPDLGQMLFDGVQRLDYSPWEVLFPSMALTLIILAFTFIGDGLRDAVDPRMHS